MKIVIFAQEDDLPNAIEISFHGCHPRITTRMEVAGELAIEPIHPGTTITIPPASPVPIHLATAVMKAMSDTTYPLPHRPASIVTPDTPKACRLLLQIRDDKELIREIPREILKEILYRYGPITGTRHVESHMKLHACLQEGLHHDAQIARHMRIAKTAIPTKIYYLGKITRKWLRICAACDKKEDYLLLPLRDCLGRRDMEATLNAMNIRTLGDLLAMDEATTNWQRLQRIGEKTFLIARNMRKYLAEMLKDCTPKPGTENIAEKKSPHPQKEIEK